MISHINSYISALNPAQNIEIAGSAVELSPKEQ